MKSVARGLLITVMLLVALAPMSMAAEKTVAFIRNYALTPASDDLMAKQLQELGFKVSEFDHANLAGFSPINYSLIVISSTVNSGSVATGSPAIFTSATPIINWEPGLGDELGFASATSNATNTSIDLKGEHPIIAGFSGNVAIKTASEIIMGGGGTLGKGVQVLGTVGNANVFMVADKGAILLNGSVATSRRVFFPGSDIFMTVVTDAGKTLFKQTVAWVTAK